MCKRPKRIIRLTTCGIIVGLWNIFIGFSSPNNITIIFGVICGFLAFGIYMLWNWVRIIVIVFAYLSIGVGILFFIAAIFRVGQGFAGIAFLFYFPVLIWSLLLIDNLRRKEIKAYFKSTEDKF